MACTSYSFVLSSKTSLHLTNSNQIHEQISHVYTKEIKCDTFEEMKNSTKGGDSERTDIIIKNRGRIFIWILSIKIAYLSIAHQLSIRIFNQDKRDITEHE